MYILARTWVETTYFCFTSNGKRKSFSLNLNMPLGYEISFLQSKLISYLRGEFKKKTLSVFRNMECKIEWFHRIFLTRLFRTQFKECAYHETQQYFDKTSYSEKLFLYEFPCSFAILPSVFLKYKCNNVYKFWKRKMFMPSKRFLLMEAYRRTWLHELSGNYMYCQPWPAEIQASLRAVCS